MTKNINVRGLSEINDISYRYRMPSISVINQKNKTVINNINEIASALETNPEFIIDFFRKKFSISIKYDNKSNYVELKSILQIDLQNALFEFIEYFIICPLCKNPETELYIKKESLYIKCKACSNNSKVNMVNKLTEKVTESIKKIL